MKKLPLGIQTFSDIINDNYYYVDKTEFIQLYYEKYKQKVVILIDEYDKPILDNIEKSITPYKIRELLKGFYSVIKDSDRYIKFVFITGVTKFSKVNLFSGLNNLTDISLDPEFAEICGYTQTELTHSFGDIINDAPMNEIKEWYNGYNYLGEKVYNPFDVLNFLKSKIFKNYWFESGTPTFLLKLIEKRKYPIPELESVKISEELLNSFDIGSIELETILFQTGYLTIDGLEQQGIRRVFRLSYPNLEVKHSLGNYIIKHITNQNVAESEKMKNSLYTFLYEGKPDQFMGLFQAFFASIPYNWFTNNTIADYEGYYASVFYTYFTAIGVEVRVEDTTNQGRLDMVAILNRRCYVFEFKVNEQASSGRALEQLQEKKYHEKFIGYNSSHIGSGSVQEIYLVGIEFNKIDRNITSLDWERVN